MAGIGDDIAEVFTDVGTEASCTKHETGEIFTEYVDFETQAEANSPFQIQFMANATLMHSTKINAGDILSLDDGNKYLVVAKNQSRFENHVVVWEALLYWCNCVVNIQRRTHKRNEDYVMEVKWPFVISAEPALVTGTVVDKNVVTEKFGDFLTKVGMILHISGNLNVQMGDRCIVQGSSIVYEVQGIEDMRLNNTLMCALDIDTRE